jgi:RNA polymerase sigma-70 factor, ECF subfamily
VGSAFQGARFTQLPAYVAPAPARGLSGYRRVYEENRHRVYALAFWMTDNELTAEAVMGRTFERAFSHGTVSAPDAIDRALIAELEEIAPLGELTLRCLGCSKVVDARRSRKRVDLERAVVQLPPTERLVFLLHDVESYEHGRIARLLGFAEEDSQTALHEARLRIRELLVESRC